MSRDGYNGPGELTSAIGEGTKGVVVGGAVGAGTGAILAQSKSIQSVLLADTGVGKAVGEVTEKVASSSVGQRVSNAASQVASSSVGRSVSDAASRVSNHMPGMNIEFKMPTSGTGRAAVLTGAFVATAAGLYGLASGWGRASNARQSWVERTQASNTQHIR